MEETTKPESIFRTAARARWPRATIEGDGNFCLVVDCYSNKGVWLFATLAEAAALRDSWGGDCGHASCFGNWCHRILRLIPAPEPEPKPKIKSIWYGRDRD
jgi:hypothetical protein